MLDYFSQTKNLESVSNRIEELPKVGGLSPAMVRTLVSRGFNNLLKFGLSEAQLDEVAGHVSHITLGVAQRVHEYCSKLAALIANDRNRYSNSLLEKADRDWLLIGLRQCYAVVESHLNSKKTTIARRNQVIYCIGHLELHQFDSTDIRSRIEETFPESIASNHMGIGSILTELASGKNPLLTKNTNTSEYRIVDPRYLMCIRVSLLLDPQTKTVHKGNFKL